MVQKQDDVSLTGSYSPDGTEQTLESETVPSGQLWYVDTVFAGADGNGSTTSHAVQLGADQSGLLDALSSLQHAERSAIINIDTDSTSGPATESEPVGDYVTGGEEVRLVAADDSDNSTVYYTATIRRIL